MRKGIKTMLTIMISIFVMGFLSTTVSATDDVEDYYNGSYYFKNFNVSIEANDKREFIVTETIDVYFNKEMSGIIRGINLVSYFEKWTISDISVEGGSFEVEEGAHSKNIIIGSEGEKVSGDKKYIIKYTLNYYDDEEVDGDYIYLDLLPKFTKVENFKAEITYPRGSKLEDIRLIDFISDSENTNLAKYSLKDNKIIVESIDVIEENNEFVIHAKLIEGTFKNAKEYPYPYIINKDVMNINITKDKNYIIERHFEIDVKRGGEFYPSNEYIKLWEGYEDKINNLNISNSSIETFDGNYINIPKEPGIYDFVVSYTISPKLEYIQKIIIKQAYMYCRLKNLEVNINSEIPIIKNNINFQELGMYGLKDRHSLQTNRNTIFFNYLNRFHPDEEVSITLIFDNSAEKMKILWTSIIVSIVSILLFIGIKVNKKSESKSSLVTTIAMLILSFIPIIKIHIGIPKFSITKLGEALNFMQIDIIVILMIYTALRLWRKSKASNKYIIKSIIIYLLAVGFFAGFVLLEMKKLDVNISFNILISVILSSSIAFLLSVFISKINKDKL